MKPSLILHIGMDKTGSTSIRTSLARGLDDPNFGFLCPGGQENAGRLLSLAFRDHPKRFHYYRKLGTETLDVDALRRKALADLDQAFKSSRAQTLIISAEALTRFEVEALERLRDWLNERVSSISVVGYVRRPAEYMESHLQQQIKTLALGKLAPERLFPHYREQFEKFDRVFGRERVRLFLFNPAGFASADVVLDFCSRIGASFPAERVIRSNESLSRPALSFLYAYRHEQLSSTADAVEMAANLRLVNRLRKLGGAKLRLHSTMVEPVLAANSEEVAWMEQRLGESLAEDIGRNDGIAIRSTDDLLEFSDESLDWLALQLGPKWVERRGRTMRPAKVARWIDALRSRLTKRAEGRTAPSRRGNRSEPADQG